MCVVCLNQGIAIVRGCDDPDQTMCAAVSENRRRVTCFVCVGYKWAEQRAGMPRRDRSPPQALARRSGWSLALR